MNISNIKKKLLNIKGKQIRIKVYIGRNRYEYLLGEVENMYDNIFTFKSNNSLKSFTYSDLLIKNVIILK